MKVFDRLTNNTFSNGFKENTENGHSSRFIIIVAYIVAAAVYYYFASKIRKIVIFPDEQLYYSIAKSILTKHSIVVMNLPCDFHNVLYSICLIPAFLMQTKAAQYTIIGLINSFLITSGIFPVYLIGRKFTDKSGAVLCALLYLINPNMAWSATLMSENLYVPLALWGLYLMTDLIELSLKNDDRSLKKYLKLSFITGLIIFILFTCKEITLFFIATYGVYIIFRIFRNLIAECKNKRNIKKSEKAEKSAVNSESDSLSKNIKNINQINNLNLISSKNLFLSLLSLGIGFALPYVIFRFYIFADSEDSYFNNMSSQYLMSLDAKGALSFVYDIAYFIIMSLLAFTIIPFAICFTNQKKMSRTARHTFYFILIFMAVAAVVVSYTISIHEDFEAVHPNAHIRYITYIFPVLMILMMHALRKRSDDKKNLSEDMSGDIPAENNCNEARTTVKHRYVTLGTFIICMIITGVYFLYFLFEDHIIVNDYTVGNADLQFFSANQHYQLPIMCVYAGLTCVCLILLLLGKKCGRTFATILLTIVEAANMSASLHHDMIVRELTGDFSREAAFLTNLEETNPDKTFLVIDDDDKNAMLFSYFDYDNVDYADENTLKNSFSSLICHSGESWSEMSADKCLKNVKFDTYYDLDKVDYIIFCYNEGFEQGADDSFDARISDDYATQIESFPSWKYRIYQLDDPYHVPEIDFN